MKNIVRALVVVLAVTGAVATTLTPSASAHKVTATRTSCILVPTCPPDDPNACGMAQGR